MRPRHPLAAIALAVALAAVSACGFTFEPDPGGGQDIFEGAPDAGAAPTQDLGMQHGSPDQGNVDAQVSPEPEPEPEPVGDAGPDEPPPCDPYDGGADDGGPGDGEAGDADPHDWGYDPCAPDGGLDDGGLDDGGIDDEADLDPTAEPEEDAG